MRRTLVLNVAGLTPKLVGERTPNLAALASDGGQRPLSTIEPAVTFARASICSPAEAALKMCVPGASVGTEARAPSIAV